MAAFFKSDRTVRKVRVQVAKIEYIKQIKFGLWSIDRALQLMASYSLLRVTSGSEHYRRRKNGLKLYSLPVKKKLAGVTFIYVTIVNKMIFNSINFFMK